jgi:hypothetical protein
MTEAHICRLIEFIAETYRGSITQRFSRTIYTLNKGPIDCSEPNSDIALVAK